MDPDELWIGKVLFVGLASLTIWGVGALLTSRSEGARRIKVVIGGLITLSIGAILFAIGGPGLLAVGIIVVAIVIWVGRGFSK